MRTLLTTAAAATLLLFAGLAGAQKGEETDPLAELATLGDEAVDTGPEGGGSIRAKKDADLTRSTRLKDSKNLEAKVEKVSSKGFPIVAVTVTVTKSAKDGAGKDIAKNAKLVIVPKLKVEGKKVALEDEATLLNAGSFYLQQGDKVVVRLGTNKGKYWEAEYIERK